MNLKVANLVAIQFGIFVGILGWLAYSRIPPANRRTVAEMREPVAEPVSTFASAPNPAEQRSQTEDYPGDQERTQPVAEPPAPAMQHQVSAAAVQQNSALAAQLYYQQIAPRRYASSGLANSSIATVAPSSTEVAHERAVVQTDDPMPETVAYVEPAPGDSLPSAGLVRRLFSPSPLCESMPADTSSRRARRWFRIGAGTEEGITGAGRRSLKARPRLRLRYGARPVSFPGSAPSE